MLIKWLCRKFNLIPRSQFDAAIRRRDSRTERRKEFAFQRQQEQAFLARCLALYCATLCEAANSIAPNPLPRVADFEQYLLDKESSEENP